VNLSFFFFETENRNFDYWSSLPVRSEVRKHFRCWPGREFEAPSPREPPGLDGLPVDGSRFLGF
jgi:hypothetical protein